MPLALADAFVVFPRVDTVYVRFEEVGEASVPFEGVARGANIRADVEDGVALLWVTGCGVDILRSASSVWYSNGWIHGEEAFWDRGGNRRGWGGVGSIVRRGCGKCHSFSVAIGRNERVGITGDVFRSFGIVMFRGLRAV